MKSIRYFPFGLLCLLLCALAGAANGQAPLSLFNGTSMLGWNAHGNWSAAGGTLTSTGGGSRYVLTAMPFGDARLDFEYNASGAMGAKFRLWASHDNNGGLMIDLDPTGSPAGVGGIQSLSHSSLATVPPVWHHVQLEALHGQINVRIDGQPSGSAGGLGARAGYLGFEASGEGSLQLRTIKLVPLNLNNVYNGTDLSGWKSLARTPDAKGGVGHDLTKTITFGMGGGSSKPHEAKWSVVGGSIHGQDGPGGLENGSVEDGIFQISAAMRGEPKKENQLSLAVRGIPGQLGGGYAVGIGPYAGNIADLVHREPLRATGFVDETILVAGRTIAVWVGGNLVTVHTDTRAENSSALKGAKTGGGSVALLLPNNSEQVDVAHVALASLPTAYGVAARAPAPPPPAPVVAAVAAPVTPAPAGASEAEKVLLQQQQAAAKKDASDQANKQRVASLMSQALATNDPQQQMSAYGQVVQIDPSNTAAVQGYKDAQAKVQAQQDAQQRAATAQVSEQQQAQTRDEQTNASVAQAQSAFLAGHLSQASVALSVAERLNPGNPVVRALRARISSAQAVRSRLYFGGGALGFVGLVAALTMWLRRRKQQRFPVLEITRGLDSGRSFSIERDTVRIGAVAQNGSQKNDIVIQDVEHAISRFHCEVARKNGQLYITDLKSSNGTRLNGERLQPGRPELLRKGSTITLAENVDLRLGFDRRTKKTTS